MSYDKMRMKINIIQNTVRVFSRDDSLSRLRIKLKEKEAKKVECFMFQEFGIIDCINRKM